MKAINNLYEKIISTQNLAIADERARLGKKGSRGVKIHDKARGCNIIALHNILAEKKYHTSPYKISKVYTPKERDIYKLPYFPDRILHHAIMNEMERIWVSVFNDFTYSCIKGKGIHAAVVNVKRDLQDVQGTRYCLKIDIRKFYHSIDHDILKAILRKKIKDKDLLNLLYNVIDSAPGVPIGNYLSQYFANLYLAYLDHWIKRVKRVKYYYRYADDMVILASSKRELHELLAEIRTYLHVNLKLEIKGNYQVFPVKEGLDFIGYVFFHTHTRMRKSIKQAYARAVARGAGAETLAAYKGWADHADSKHLVKKLFKKAV